MSTQDDLLAINAEIKHTIESMRTGFLEDAQDAIAQVIETSRMAKLAAECEAIFNGIYYPNYPDTQLKAFELAVHEMPKFLGIEYLAAAKLIATSSLVSGEIHADVLKICKIITDDKEGGFDDEYVPMSKRGRGPKFNP